MSDVRVGQIWKERGYQRHVRVEAIEGERARIRTCTSAGTSHVTVTTTARLSRFGKGYLLVQDVA